MAWIKDPIMFKAVKFAEKMMQEGKDVHQACNRSANYYKCPVEQVYSEIGNLEKKEETEMSDELRNAVSLASQMVKDGKKVPLACHLASKKYGVRTHDVASHLGRRGASVNNQNRSMVSNG